jgi:hypothetical protein
MKRLLSMFTLAATLLLGFALPHTASAAIPTCVQVDSGEGVPWPSGPYTLDCTGVQFSAQGQAMYDALNNSFTSSQTGKLATWMAALQKANPQTGVFYIFNTPQNFLDYAGAYFPKTKTHPVATPYPTSIPSGDFAFSVSISGVNQAPIYTVVFVEPTLLITNLDVQKISAHEAGHYLDWLFASTAKSTTTVSNSSYYATELTYDWTYFNKLTPCGNPGVFNTFTDFKGQVANRAVPPVPNDPNKGVYICNGTDNNGFNNGSGDALSSTYSSDKTPQAVLAAAWAYIYLPGSTGGKNTTFKNLELFAETYAAGVSLAGQNDNAYSPSEADVYLGNSQFQGSEFVCTQAFMRNLLLTNTLPLTTSPPLNWPTQCPLFTK